MKKHYLAGVATKSPRTLFHMKREAEKNERKGRKSTCVYKSIKDLFKGAKQ